MFVKTFDQFVKMLKYEEICILHLSCYNFINICQNVLRCN